jgi:phytoene synthase
MNFAAGRTARKAVRASIEHHSKSFALASRLLPAQVSHDAAALYGYCRHADDAIDLVPEAEQAARLIALRAELAEIYRGTLQTLPLMAAFQRVVQDCAVPRGYFDELLCGMEMDVQRFRYRSMDDLLRYAYRVAGTVGLMMCHVMGVRESAALRHAAHLGIAMQLTNIARDVREDWQRGRLYLPQDLLVQAGVSGLTPASEPELPRSAAAGIARATYALLDHAEEYYRSGDAGLRYLSTRCGLAIRAARMIYSTIGERVRAQDCDPFAPRAFVSKRHKLLLLGYAASSSALHWPKSAGHPRPRVPSHSVTDLESVLFVTGG